MCTQVFDYLLDRRHGDRKWRAKHSRSVEGGGGAAGGGWLQFTRILRYLRADSKCQQVTHLFQEIKEDTRGSVAMEFALATAAPT